MAKIEKIEAEITRLEVEETAAVVAKDYVKAGEIMGRLAEKRRELAAAAAPTPGATVPPATTSTTPPPATPASVAAPAITIPRPAESGGMSGTTVGLIIGIVFAAGFVSMCSYGAGVSSTLGFRQMNNWRPPIVPNVQVSPAAPAEPRESPVLRFERRRDPVVEDAKKGWDAEMEERSQEAVNPP